MSDLSNPVIVSTDNLVLNGNMRVQMMSVTEEIDVLVVSDEGKPLGMERRVIGLLRVATDAPERFRYLADRIKGLGDI